MADKTPEEIIEAASKERILSEERLERAIENKKTQEEILKLTLSAFEARKDELELALKIGNLKGQERDTAFAQLEASEEKIKKSKEELKVIEAQTAEMERQLGLQNQLGKSIEGLANKWRGGMVEGILEAGVNFKALGESIAKAVTLTNLAGTAMETVRQSTMATAVMFDQAQSSFAAATGAGRTYSGVIDDVRVGSSLMGVGVAEASKAVGDLYTGMSLFSMQNEDTQKKLARTTAELESLGISGATTAANMEFSMRVLGQSGDEANASAKDMAKFAIGIGVAPAQMAEEFKQAGPKLAGFGKNATKVFQGLARQSKKLGIEMNSLLGITEQFDTFEGAANAAGQLNSMLGGPFLDSMQLMNAESREQQIQMVRNAVLMSGKSFDSMHRLERQAIASSLGISDMSEATKLFSESSITAASGMKEQSISAEELAKRQAAAVSVTKKLDMAMQSFAVLVEPLVNGLASVIEGALSLNDAMGGYLAPTLAGIAVVAFFVFKAIGFVTSAFAALTPLSGPASVGLGALATGMGSLGKATLSLIPFVLSVGGALLMVGAGVALAAYGVSVLIDSFTTFLPVLKENASVFPMLIGGIISLGGALAILAVTGSGGLLVMGGIALAALGIAFALRMILEPVAEVGNAIAGMFAQVNAFKEDGPLSKFINIVTDIDTDAIENLEGLMDQADRMVTIQAKLAAIEATQTVTNAIDKLISFVAPDASSSSSESKREIILQLNDREFGRAVVAALDDDMKLSLA